MNRAFDPALLDEVDACTLGDPAVADEPEPEDLVLVERCTVCGTDDLVFEDERLVDLNGKEHKCPES